MLRPHPLADLPSRRDQSPWQSQFEVDVDQVRIGQALVPFSGRVLVVSDGRFDQLLPGDRIEAFGLIRSFAGPTNPGERDLRDVYRRRGLHARIDADGPDQIVWLQSTYRHWIYRQVASTAQYSRDQLLQHTSQQNGPLALALVLGQREFVANHIRDLLLVTGTVHLLSVSGLHLAIVVVLARWIGLLLGLPLAVRILWIITVCALYTAITGGRPPVVRASILVATLMISIWIGRQGQPINTLSLAAIILLILNPENVFSVGVQLSFLAVATLLLCGRRPSSSSPAVEQALQRERRLENLTEGRFAQTATLRALGFVVRLAGDVVQRMCDGRQHSTGLASVPCGLVCQRAHQRCAGTVAVCRACRRGRLRCRRLGMGAGRGRDGLGVQCQPERHAGCDRIRGIDTWGTFLVAGAANLVGGGVLRGAGRVNDLGQPTHRFSVATRLDRDVDGFSVDDGDVSGVDGRLSDRSDVY